MDNTIPLYHTQLEGLQISEYGRILQNVVSNIVEVEDKKKRTELAEATVALMIHFNPAIKELDNYNKKLWDHLFRLSEYKLDVDSPHPKPEPENIFKKPEPVEYKDTLIKFRFYGRNLQNMVEDAADMEEGELKDEYINLLASYMTNSSKSWNDENLTPETVTNHIKTLSKGKLDLNPDDIDIRLGSYKRKKPNIANNSNGNNNNRKNKKRRRK